TGSRSQFALFDMLLLRPADMQVLEWLAASLDQRRDEFIDRFTREAAESVHRTVFNRQRIVFRSCHHDRMPLVYTDQLHRDGVGQCVPIGPHSEYAPASKLARSRTAC